MRDLSRALYAFFSQPWGVVGAICIMFGVTAFNSRRLQARLTRLTTRRASLPNILNGFNLVGGACLLVNAWIRDEIVWIVLEIYFVVIALKGLWQVRASVAATRSEATSAANGAE